VRIFFQNFGPGINEAPPDEAKVVDSGGDAGRLQKAGVTASPPRAGGTPGGGEGSGQVAGIPSTEPVPGQGPAPKLSPRRRSQRGLRSRSRRKCQFWKQTGDVTSNKNKAEIPRRLISII